MSLFYKKTGDGSWSMALPIYTTRKSANGDTASYEISIWQSMLAIMIVWLNIIVWGVIGFIEAGKVIAGLV